MIVIYKITSPSNKIYIGQTIDFKRRLKDYRTASNLIKQPRLGNSFIKYGFDNHLIEVIEICEVEKLNERERYHQIKLNPELNCRVQGTNDKSGYLSEETKKKISIAKKGSVPWNKGIKTGIVTAIAKVVLNLETGIYYDSISQASKSLNIKRTTLNAMLKGQNPNNTQLIYV